MAIKIEGDDLSPNPETAEGIKADLQLATRDALKVHAFTSVDEVDSGRQHYEVPNLPGIGEVLLASRTASLNPVLSDKYFETHVILQEDGRLYFIRGRREVKRGISLGVGGWRKERELLPNEYGEHGPDFIRRVRVLTTRTRMRAF